MLVFFAIGRDLAVCKFRVCSIVFGMMILVEYINGDGLNRDENDENNGFLLPRSIAGIDDQPLGTHFFGQTQVVLYPPNLPLLRLGVI